MTNGSLRAGRARLLIGVTVALAALAMPGVVRIAADPAADPQIRTFSVRNEPVEQVLLAFAERTGISLVTDDTVTGTVSVVLHDVSARETVMQIAGAADLLVEDQNGVFRISRVHLRRTGADAWTLRSSGAPLGSVFREISRESRRAITVEAGLTAPVSFSIGPLTIPKLLEALCDHAGLHLEESRSGYRVGGNTAPDTAPESAAPAIADEIRLITDDVPGSEIRLTARRTTVRAILDYLFEHRHDHFLPVASLRAPVNDLTVSAPDQQVLWHRIRTALNLHSIPDGDTWIVTESGQEQRLAQFRSQAVVTLRNRSVSEVEEALARIRHLEIQVNDHRRNVLVLRALPETLAEALELVAILEEQPRGNGTLLVSLERATPSEAGEILRRRFPDAEIITDDRLGNVIVTAPENSLSTIRTALENLDHRPETRSYGVRHAEPDELIRAAGSDHGLDLLVAGSDGRSLVLRGNRQNLQRTLELFHHVDRPREQLRFDLCIIQYQGSTSAHRGTRASITRDGSTVGVFETTWDATARFDQLLTLQFDLLSALGYQAALAVTGELAENSARLVVDTSLRAGDGETVTLENAATYRYRDYPEDDESSTVYGITREIDSGLEVELRGRYHRDRSVTVDIRVSLSKQGADLSGRGNPPPTSRKVVETTVRVAAGEPIVIGGLLQQEETGSTRRIPILGRIPVLRRFLENESSTREETEMVLYLSVFPGRPEDSGERLERQTARLAELLGEHSR